MSEETEVTKPVVEEPTEEQSESELSGYSLKVDGEDKELTKAELNEYLANIQKYSAGDKRLAEAAEARKNLETVAKELFQELKTNPFGLLARPELGVNIDEHVQAYLQAKQQQEALTPEQKRIAELEEKLSASAALEEQMYLNEINSECEKVLQVGNLKPTTENVRRALHIMRVAVEAGTTLSPEDICAETKRQYQMDLQEHIGELSEAQELYNFLGPTLMGKIVEMVLANGASESDLVEELRPVKQASPKLEGLSIDEAFERFSQRSAGLFGSSE